MDKRNTFILFLALLILSLIVLNLSKDKKITSIYSLENYSNPEIKNERMANILYSGDLLEISDETKRFMNRQDYNSEIVFIKPEEKGINTNLSKLRIISSNHSDKSLQLPVKFGDTISIQHNAYIENKNVSRFIKYGEKIQSHQQGEMFKNYKIINPSKVDDTSFVQYNSPILFRRADNLNDGYLTIEKDSTVTSKNPLNKSSKFILHLRRVYEPYEKNLCVCVNEVLYP